MIIVAGEALIDLLVHPDGRLAAVPGGGPFNTARTIARLGGEVAFLGCLSTDRFGEMLRGTLGDDGVDLSMILPTDAPTTLAIAELDERGAATYRFHTAETSAPGLSAAAVREALATGPQAFHIGTLGLILEPMAGALIDGLAEVPAAALVMVDPNPRPLVIHDRAAYLARLDAVWHRADVVKASREDLGYLAPDRSAEAAARDILDRGPAVVIVTDGGDRILVVTRDETVGYPVPPIRVVDTVGSGDAFGGGFLARWIERGLGRDALADPASLRDAMAVGIEVAGLTSQRAGADPPRRADIGRDRA